jgi:hypothetical protein
MKYLVSGKPTALSSTATVGGNQFRNNFWSKSADLSLLCSNTLDYGFDGITDPGFVCFRLSPKFSNPTWRRPSFSGRKV